MANLDTNYDVDHRADAIAEYEKGILVCLAGPGTGKTYSFLRRIEALTTTHNVDVENICYFTFIREISKAFATDYEQEFGSEVLGPRISTLHSFACRLVRNQGFRYGFDGALYFMSIADEDDECSAVFLNDLLPFVKRGQIRTAACLRKALASVKVAWQNGVDPESLGEPAIGILPTCLNLSRAYRLIDWDQAVPLAHALFETLGEPPEWIERIEHFLVDEYQDFNRAEQAFIGLLATSAKSTIIVGDDDQSLYSGRGGSPDGLRELYHSNSIDQVTLVRCYRCKSRILGAANAFLATMRSDPREMIPRFEGGELACHGFKSRKAEIAYLADFLQDSITALPPEPRPKEGVVCLFPSWKALDSYMACLTESGVPCYSRKTSPHTERTWLERALALICNPNQRFLERLLLERFDDIKPRHKQTMVELILESDISPVEALCVLISRGILSGAAATAAQAFCELCEVLSSQDADQIAVIFTEHFGIETPDLCERIDTFIQQLDQSNQEDAIANLCDVLLPESAPPNEDPRAVLCLTMHGSKGLTRKTVVLPGLEDAWLPGSTTEDSIDERKRLFYVALTRATDQVLVTYPRTRARGDPLNYQTPGRGQPSRFIRQSGIPLIRHG
jgi:DNA helicase-2/ATP-dependent DNA helicase PcrA